MSDGRDPQITSEKNLHTFGLLLSELKTDLVEFVRTRVQLLLSELPDKTKRYKKTAGFAAVALICGSVAFLLFTAAAVALVAVAFWGSPFTFFWGFLIIGICYLLLGSITLIVAYYGLDNLAPQKTIKVLQDDKTWVRAELSRQT
jgi:uncharacterized membrane protein YqjE